MNTVFLDSSPTSISSSTKKHIYKIFSQCLFGFFFLLSSINIPLILSPLSSWRSFLTKVISLSLWSSSVLLSVVVMHPKTWSVLWSDFSHSTNCQSWGDRDPRQDIFKRLQTQTPHFFQLCSTVEPSDVEQQQHQVLKIKPLLLHVITTIAKIFVSDYKKWIQTEKKPTNQIKLF